MNIQKLLFAASLVTAISAHAAEHQGATTLAERSGRHIKVGVSETKRYEGMAGINVVDKSLQIKKNNAGQEYANNKFVAFAKIEKTSKNLFVSNDIAGKDKNDVIVANMYRMSGGVWNWIKEMPDHSQLGRLSYAQAGNEDVWFGTWSDVAAGAEVNAKGKNTTAFYSGINPTTNLPTSGTATYDVKGVNNYNQLNSEVMRGQLTADFGAKKLSGALTRSNLSIALDANINAKTASFDGNAKATAADKVVSGMTRGQFFGHQGAVVAGVADFGKNNVNNTAFGGAKIK